MDDYERCQMMMSVVSSSQLSLFDCLFGLGSQFSGTCT